MRTECEPQNTRIEAIRIYTDFQKIGHFCGRKHFVCIARIKSNRDKTQKKPAQEGKTAAVAAIPPNEMTQIE